MGIGRSIFRLWASRLVLFVLAVMLLIAVVFLRTGTVYVFAEQTEQEKLMRRPLTVTETNWSPGEYARSMILYTGKLVRGELTYATESGRPTKPQIPLWPLLADSWQESFRLFGLAFVIGSASGVLIGSMAALRSRVLRGTVMGVSVVGLSLPDFFVVLMGQIATLWSNRHWGISLWPILAGTASLKDWIFPALVLALAPAGYAIRLTSSALDEVMQADYIRTARGKGVPEPRVILGHAFRNIVPRIASGLPAMLNVTLSGLVVVERLTVYPGLSKWMMGGDTASVATAGIFFVAWFMIFDALANTLRLWVSPVREEAEER